MQLKHARRFTAESLKATFISNVSYFKQFGHQVMGVTGSLGSENERQLLKQWFPVKFFYLPRFKEENLIQYLPKVTSQAHHWINEIKQSIKDKFENKRAVLVICEQISDVHSLAKQLKQDYPHLISYTSVYETLNLNHIREKTLIIATNLAGRGTDLKLSNNVIHQGGLHVITAYMPPNIRVQIQAFGRGARAGQPGSAQFIIHSNEENTTIADLLTARDHKEQERLQQLKKQEVPAIEREESLLFGFSEQGVVCEGFLKLYERLSKQLKQSEFFDKEAYQLQLSSMKNQWALWLDQFSNQIQLVESVDKNELAGYFKQFADRLEQDVLTGDYGFIREPLEWLKMGQTYRQKEDWAQAFKAYSNGTATKPMAYGIYYQAACQINRDYSKGLEAKKEFKKYLYSVKEGIAYESSQLAIGCDLSPEGLENQYFNRKQAEQLIKDLSKKFFKQDGQYPVIKDFRVSKRLKFVNDQLIMQHRLNNEAVQLTLPGLLNAGPLRQRIAGALPGWKERSNQLVDLEKDFYSLEDDCLPTQSAWINLCKVKEFIEEDNSVEDQYWIDELPEIKESDDEEQKKLHSCTKKIQSQSNTVEGLKKSLLEELKKEYPSEEFKEEIINGWFDRLQGEQTEHTFSSSTSVLNYVTNKVQKSSFIKKNIRYKVKQAACFKAVDRQYEYVDLNHLQENYKDPFKEWDSEYQSYFLKLILRENPEADKVQLQEQFELMDLDLAKDKKHAAKQLWDYLLGKEVIKSPRLNIGLKLGSEAVKERLEDLKGAVKAYLNKDERLKRLLKTKEEKEKALDTIYVQLIGYVGSLHQLEDDRVKATFFDIKQTYFIDQYGIG